MAIPRPEFSPTARRDLLLIIGHSENHWGAEQADRYRRALEQTCDHLGSYPELGIAQSILGGARTFPVERHRIVYRQQENGVLILRIIHQRMRLADVELE